MRTISKTLLALGLGVVVVGCSVSNEDNMSVDAQGKKLPAGVTPANVPKNSAEFADKNKPAMQQNSEKAQEYKNQTK